jgi:hypothetical protein
VIVPTVLAPPAPFPLVVSQAATTAFVAPGIRRADYRLTTNAGPLVVHVVFIDPHEPTVRLGVVVAHDRMISAGETVSAMARRTGAVAGVNADYFDIGQTNQPLNVVVANGLLLRTPSKRAAMIVGAANRVTFGSFGFSGSAVWPNAAVPLTTVNEFPPQGGAGFVTPTFGALPGAPNVLAAALEAASGTLPGLPGVYRVATIGPAAKGPVHAPLLALGPAALKLAVPPRPGDEVTIDYETAPPLGGVREAVGGGPLLVVDGAAVEDPNAPAPEERNVRFPLSGAGVTADGTVMFAVVDGRQAAASIGLTRPEFAALFQGLQATGAMAFDSGGSAELTARVLGDRDASVVNAPSDGAERPVADGVFAYSDAPAGPATMLVARPATFAALPGVTVPVTLTAVDAGGRPAASQPAHASVTAAAAPGAHARRLASGGLAVSYPYRTVARVASLRLAPNAPNPDPGATVVLTATGADATGEPIVVSDVVWHADRGTIRAAAGNRATYTAAARDGVVTAEAGGAAARLVVRVGRRAEGVALFAPAGPRWTFATSPGAQPGSVAIAPGLPPTLALAFDFTTGAKAAYARTTTVFPGTPLGFALQTDAANGLLVRGLFANNLGEKRAFTLDGTANAARVSPGVADAPWRTVGVDFPSDLYPPVTLLALYVLPATSGARTGATHFRSPVVILPGSP